MGILTNDNFSVNAPKVIDDRYSVAGVTPYTSVAVANAAVAISRRAIGLTVNISGVEYWYAVGITDLDLVVKSGVSGGYSTIQDEGTALTQRTTVNFVGAGVTATDNGTNTVVTIPGVGGSDVFASDFVVSLSGGKTLGKFSNGDTVPANGLTARQVILLMGIEDIAPVYSPATFSLSKSVSNFAEIGTPYSGNNLVATFNQNDAGPLSAIRIQKNGSDLIPNGTTSPFSKTDSDTYVSSVITFQAFCNYAAGVIKNYLPSGTPDGRTPATRNPNAPQAAENNFSSSVLSLQGFYNYFFGASASNPTTSALVRALPSNQLTNAGTSFNLNTGTTLLNFTIAMPATKTLTSVFDSTAGFFITGSFTLTTFNVNDAGGNPVSYNVYTLTNAVPYAANHIFNIVTT